MSLVMGPALAIALVLGPPAISKPVLLDNTVPKPESRAARFQVVTMVSMPFAYLWASASVSVIKASNGDSRIIQNMEPKDLTMVALSISVSIAIVDLIVRPKRKGKNNTKP